MKYFILIMTLIYLCGIGKQLLHINKIQTGKDTIDKSLSGMKSGLLAENKKYLSITYFVLSIPILLYLLFSAIYVDTFIFTIICFVYTSWSIFDMSNSMKYLTDDSVSKTLNNKLYKLISIPFDLAFSIFIMYQVFLKW